MAVQALYQKDTAIYVEIFDELHHIADPETLTGVFGSNPQITHDLPPYKIGFEINSGSCLARSNATGAIYLMTNGCKYHITSIEAMKHYQFNGTAYPVDPSDQILADKLIAITPSGQDISDS